MSSCWRRRSRTSGASPRQSGHRRRRQFHQRRHDGRGEHGQPLQGAHSPAKPQASHETPIDRLDPRPVAPRPFKQPRLQSVLHVTIPAGPLCARKPA
jgi:hypothetical protein